MAMIPANPTRAARDQEFDHCPDCKQRFNVARGHGCAPLTRKQRKQQAGGR